MIISSMTAGFDSVAVSHLGHFSLFIVVIAMWIGGSPGSTAGGINNTTAGILIIQVISYLKGKDNVVFSNRRVAPQSIQKAQMVFITAFIATGISILFLVIFEPNMDIFALMFESISAISTTGLTLGVTPYFSRASKYGIIITMYVGRVGVLSFLFSFFKERDKLNYEYPDERVIVG
jgi:Trk-type K+ transport system membrane component